MLPRPRGHHRLGAVLIRPSPEAPESGPLSFRKLLRPTLDLDVTRFSRELAARTYAKMRDDFRGGVRSGVNGTPTFFINGVRFDGDWSDPTTFIAVLLQAARMGASA